MVNILRKLVHWKQRIKNEPLAIFLDYDGTLSAIAPTPEEARLPQETREILTALVQLKDVKVAIVSGRSLNDLRRIVPVQGLSWAGSHGIELKVDGAAGQRVSGRYLKKLAELKRLIEAELRALPGIVLERKPFSLAVHYRKSSPATEKKVKQFMLEVCNDEVYRGKVSIMSGKKVIEIMPPLGAGKGLAVKRILRSWGQKKYLSIFIGDDRTDEDAFVVLKGRGITIKVGISKDLTEAEYYLNSVEEVRVFLKKIVYLRNTVVS